MREDGKPERAGDAPARLTRRADFQRAARGGRVVRDAFTLQARQRDAGVEAGARVGFTVTRKVGGSVERNRIRRRLKEALRAAAPLEAEPDHDYVLMARRDALTRGFGALVDDLRGAFRAARASSARRRSRGPNPWTESAKTGRP